MECVYCMDAASSFPRCSPKLTNKACCRLPSVSRVRTVSEARTKRSWGGRKLPTAGLTAPVTVCPIKAQEGGADDIHMLMNICGQRQPQAGAEAPASEESYTFHPPPPAAFTLKSTPQSIAEMLGASSGANGRETSRNMSGEKRCHFWRMSFTFTST